MEDLSNELGIAIKNARKEKKLTMQDLAQLVDLSQSAISMIENGLRHPSPQTLIKFSKALDADFSHIVSQSVSPTSDSSLAATVPNTVTLKMEDFQATIELKNFVCSYSDPEIEKAIHNGVQQFISTIFEDPYVKEKLDLQMKRIIEETIEAKQVELNKLYKRLNRN